MTIVELIQVVIAIKEVFADAGLAVDDDRLVESAVKVNSSAMFL